MASKIDKITKLFDEVEHKNRGVTYWTERNRPAVVQIIGQLKTGQLYCMDNRWPNPFSPGSDPLVFKVFYLIK